MLRLAIISESGLSSASKPFQSISTGDQKPIQDSQFVCHRAFGSLNSKALLNAELTATSLGNSRVRGRSLSVWYPKPVVATHSSI